ncbi:MAG: class II fructose-bisphosphate aldolase family protein [Rickettsiales bacterium]|jgi:fructose-bisphosphate aldolase class II|nr:class II fructose-bisphosphate aldolase family protein [Rickettsiales bacterium]
MKHVLDKAVCLGVTTPAFNFYNLESLSAIQRAVDETGARVIFAVSESAFQYMGDEFLRWACARNYLHLDHGKSFDICKRAIALGFKSVMIDGSHLSFDENVKLSRRVAAFAHARGVWVEAELGSIGGVEDNVSGDVGLTNPLDAARFVKSVGCDSLAIAIGTSHGAHKGGGPLRFDILREVRKLLPDVPLVLHGASQIPEKYAKVVGLKKSGGTAAADIKKAVKFGINKVNIDSDARLAWTAAVKIEFAKKTGNFDPRHYLGAATEELVRLYKEEIKLIAGS